MRSISRESTLGAINLALIDRRKLGLPERCGDASDHAAVAPLVRLRAGDRAVKHLLRLDLRSDQPGEL